ncbi:MAG: ABC transporter substrate-binding protein, partial [Bacteroidetes bacterium]|nr:ABC transporter substrate-binding protein [Bacteroidota bacterium]
MNARATAILVAALLLSGCGSGQKDDGRTTVVFWHSFVSSTVPAFNELVRKFEAEHPTIRLKAQYLPTGDGLIQKLITAVQSRTAPDVCWIHADFLDKLVEADAIYRMDQFLQRPDGLSVEDMTDFFPALLDGATWRDTLYALPMEATSLALFYNRDSFKRAGLDPYRPPQTWDELRSYARQLTVDEGMDGTIEQYGFFVPVFPSSGPLNIWMNLQWIPFLWQAGGEEVNKDQTRLLINSDAGVQALTLWKNIYDDLDFSRYGLAHDVGFASQNLAMIMDGPWDLPRFRQMRDIDWAVAPLPAGPAGRATYIAGEHMALFKQTEHPNEAWTFVKWMVSADVQAQFSMSSGYLPVRKSVLEREDYKAFLAGDPA